MPGSSQSFLNRLTRGDVQSVPEAVADNLVNVFNTRKGCGSVISEFGLGDYESAANTHDAINVLIEELAALVIRYEPRLSQPQVVLRGRYGYRMIRFGLAGVLDGASCGFIVDIDTSTRRVDVWPEAG